jgi:hypothetical protein
MSTLTLHHDHIDITFTAAEKIGGLVRDQRIPTESVTSAELVADPIAATRGWRSPGLGVPGARKIGHWRGPDGHELVCVKRGEPAVRLRLRSQPYDSVLIGTDEATTLAQAIASRVG